MKNYYTNEHRMDVGLMTKLQIRMWKRCDDCPEERVLKINAAYDGWRAQQRRRKKEQVKWEWNIL